MSQPLQRSYYSASLSEFAEREDEAILGELVSSHDFDTDVLQRGAWLHQIKSLKRIAPSLPPCHLFFEFSIPRMGKRADVILLSKGIHEDPKDVTRRRDIHMTCHGQKLIVRMLTEEYERVARGSVPSSQAGYGARRSTLEQILVLRLAQQQARQLDQDLCIGFQDFFCFFMGCIRDISFAISLATGVDPAVDKVMRELHSEVTGRYDTYWGLTRQFKINRGLGQGCVAAATRSKLIMAVTQRAVTKIARGFSFVNSPALPMIAFCDDATFICNNLNDLRLAYDTSFTVAKVCGLRIKIKTGKRGENLGTSYLAVRHVKGKAIDMEGAIILPNGERIPQIRAGTQSDAPHKAKAGNRKRTHIPGQDIPHNAHTITRQYKYLGQMFSFNYEVPR